MANALILGCSHAAGAQMRFGTECPVTGDAEQIAWEAENSYPVQLAKMLGFNPLNHAISGGSNDAMFRVCTQQIAGLLDFSDVIIACWTGMSRSELYHEDENAWYGLNYTNLQTHRRVHCDSLREGREVFETLDGYEPVHNYAKQWLIYEGGYTKSRLNKIKNVLAVNSLGIKVINIDSFDGVYDFPWPKNIYRPVSTIEEEFYPWSIAQGHRPEATGHFYRPAHQAYAEYLKKHISMDYHFKDLYKG